MNQLLIANHVIDNIFTWLSISLIIAMFGSYIYTSKLLSMRTSYTQYQRRNKWN